MDLLQSRIGRLLAFFALYVTEGIPLGFTALTLATQLRRQGVDPSAVGGLVAALYLPWAWKWALGPVVDTIRWRRFGHRRTWIVGAQLCMAASLLAMIPVDFASQMSLAVALVVIHNVFGAIQDVAIDALAVNSLPQEDRGLANGLMFAGAYLGQGIGGAGVLWLMPHLGLSGGFVFVAACVLLVTTTVSLHLKEPVALDGPAASFAQIAAEMKSFLVKAVRAMFGARAAFVALLVALLPAGAQALTLTLSSNLAVELGMSDAEIGDLSFYGVILSAGSCVLGGFLSDRFGRRKMLALFLVGTALPTAWLAWRMAEFGWVASVPLDAPNRPPVPPGLVTALWIASLAHAVFNGLMYGIRTALYMDVTTPAVAATQFTAYMALLNVVTSYTAWWQGHAIERWGYPGTLGLDVALGLLGILLLPLTIPKRAA